jgi:hypothetical protein
MSIDRRSLLKSSAVVSGIVAVPAAARAFKAPALIVFDSREPKSRAFADGKPGPRIDVAHEDSQMWRSLRSVSKRQIEGLTIWSDWVLARGFLEERGLRVQQEVKMGGLFHWTMA